VIPAISQNAILSGLSLLNSESLVLGVSSHSFAIELAHSLAGLSWMPLRSQGTYPQIRFIVALRPANTAVNS